MSKKTFNITDLTKEVYGDSDTNSSVFESNRKRIGNHIKKWRKILGHSNEKFEAPIEQLGAHANLIRNTLENPDNEEALDLFKKLVKGKDLDAKKDIKGLDSLTEIFAEGLIELESERLPERDINLLTAWLQDQLSDDYYLESEKNIDEVIRTIKSDFSLFDDLDNLKSKLEIQKKYMNDFRALSTFYRHPVESQLLFQESFQEVVSSYPHSKEKHVNDLMDFLKLPPSVQQEIIELMEQKQTKPPGL
ncbi:hypothetical protein [Rossellomorea marisflavi]|uniref:hypothetical protein n=1 Tax=Rossellomorea marisflavi TaxID=189381 RepID=UPI00345A524F